METSVETPVKFTASAVAEIKRLMTQPEYKSGQHLRVGAKGGGCTGLSYVVDFALPEPTDEKYDIEGIPVIMNPSHGMYLFGMQIDYQGGLNSRGFVFNNPNATKTCGCGSSFAV